MLDFLFGPKSISRRDCLRLGGLAVGGLTLADVMRQRASANPAETRAKSVIMVYLPGGPSHLDMYDMKPEAPVEYRGEFAPTRTNVPGISICELMPRQAMLADKFAIVRGLVTHGNHDPTELLTGIHAAASGQIGSARRPAFGCVISKLREGAGPMPPYVSTSNHRLLNSYDDPEEPAYLGPAHRPFSAIGSIMRDLAPATGVPSVRLDERRQLRNVFDHLARDLEYREGFAGIDSFNARALEMIASPRVRDALDVEREPITLRERYGAAGLDFLRARRLVEAGVSVVSVAARFHVRIPEANDPGGWDTHAYNFKLLRPKLTIYDQAVAALLSDLDVRGLLEDVAVVIWGEFGRQPRIGDVTPDGRGHWGAAGFAFVAGGGLRGGITVGETDRRGERPRFRPYRSQHVLATLYRVLGVNPALTTLTDHTGRPQYLLDDPTPIAELLG
ncbi:MAG: DUF1501 domain-containing protein [Gemmataceae bacterium]